MGLSPVQTVRAAKPRESAVLRSVEPQTRCRGHVLIRVASAGNVRLVLPPVLPRIEVRDLLEKAHRRRGAAANRDGPTVTPSIAAEITASSSSVNSRSQKRRSLSVTGNALGGRAHRRHKFAPRYVGRLPTSRGWRTQGRGHVSLRASPASRCEAITSSRSAPRQKLLVREQSFVREDYGEDGREGDVADASVSDPPRPSVAAEFVREDTEKTGAREMCVRCDSVPGEPTWAVARAQRRLHVWRQDVWPLVRWPPRPSP